MPEDDPFEENSARRDALTGELRAIEAERAEVIARLRGYPASLERDKALLEQLGKQWDMVKAFSDDLEETADKFGLDRLTEGARMAYDWFKHLTTVSTGLLLLITALLRAFFPDPRWPLLVAVSLVAFLLAALASVLAMAGRADEATVTPSVMRSAARCGVRSAWTLCRMGCSTSWWAPSRWAPSRWAS